GDAFSGGAGGGVGGVDVAQEAAAPAQGFHIAVFARFGDGGFDIRFDTGVELEVVFDERVRLRAGNAQPLRQPEGGDAVDDAEVDHLGGAAHLRQYLVHRHTVH